MKAAWKLAWACLWQVGNANGVEVVLGPRPRPTLPLLLWGVAAPLRHSWGAMWQLLVDLLTGEQGVGGPFAPLPLPL